MFTIDQLKQAHSKVKSGADFPVYIKDIKQLGVVKYETFVEDGHVNYYGTGEYKTTSPAKYDAIPIAHASAAAQFRADLISHQQGNTDYLTFCRDCAKSGIEKWVVDITTMTCTYYDQSGNNILTENIPIK